MAEATQQDGQKTIVSFVVGLLIGGLLVWAFSGPSADAPMKDKDVAENTATTTTDTNESGNTEETASEEESNETAKAPSLPVGDGSVTVKNQPAGRTVNLESVTFPVAEGWIGVRVFAGEELGSILGVVRFSESQGLVPNSIQLQAPTTRGTTYAIVVFTENGDRQFNLANDVQIDTVFATFDAE